MPLSNNPYATLDQVRVALSLKGTQDDAYLQELIVEATATLDTEIGYSFQSDTTSATRVYNGNGKVRLMLDNTISVTQVLQNTFNITTGYSGPYSTFFQTTQTQDITADCVLGPANVNLMNAPYYTLTRLSGIEFYEGTQNIKVTGIFGYPEIPADIVRACIRLVVWMFKMRDANYATVMIEHSNLKQIYDKDLPAAVLRTIAKYQHVGFRTH